MSQTKNATKASPQECRDNVYNRYTALERALKRPSHAPTEVLNACASQSALADLDFPSFSISQMCRNTMYKYADKVLAAYATPEGKTGRHYLDWLRKQVLKKAASATGFRTKVARQQRAKARRDGQKNKHAATEKAMLACEKAYWHLFQSVRSEVRSQNIDPVTRDRLANVLNNHSETFHGVFDSAPDKALPDNVVPITR